MPPATDLVVTVAISPLHSRHVLSEKPVLTNYPISNHVPFFRTIALMLIVFAVVLCAQERNDVPTVDVIYPKFTYRSEPCALSPSHFRNMRAYIFSEHRVEDSAVLRNGHYEDDGPPERGRVSTELGWLRLPAPKKTMLAVADYFWEWVGGSSSQSEVVQVFGCKNDRLLLIQQISNDSHGQHAGVDYDVRSGILTVKSVRYGAGAHCCPEKLDIVTFKWNGYTFEQLGWKTVPMPK